MTIQRVSDKMQEYNYIEFIQFNYFQVMNINFKKCLCLCVCVCVCVWEGGGAGWGGGGQGPMDPKI